MFSILFDEVLKFIFISELLFLMRKLTIDAFFKGKKYLRLTISKFKELKFKKMILPLWSVILENVLQYGNIQLINKMKSAELILKPGQIKCSLKSIHYPMLIMYYEFNKQKPLHI